MAELLFKAVSATHANPLKDARGCYKAGDLVDVKDNGFEWGRSELKAPAQGGQFIVLKITDVTAQQVVNFIRTRWACEALDPIKDAQGNTTTRRRVRIDVDQVPPGVRTTMDQTGQYATTWAAVRQYVRDKLTNTTAAGVAIG